MKIGIILALFISIILWVYKSTTTVTDSTKIRVINQSEILFSNVSLFSISFGNLKPKDTSVYQVLLLDDLRDDTLIYCSVGEINYARYLKIPPNNIRRVSYVLDSIHNGIIHVSTTFDN